MLINPERNCINLKKEEREKPIYRVFPIERLLQIFDTYKLVLVRPHTWEDPFENYVFSKLVETAKNTQERRFYEVYRKSLFGQCWSLTSESDAMWRIYSPNKMSVKVKTTISKLLETLQLQMNHVAEMSAYIAKVKYEEEEKLEEIYNWLQGNFKGQSPEDILTLVETLIYKRPEYKHEDEVRIIYFESFGTPKEDHVLFDFDPIFHFDEIIFDPRMKDDLCETFTNIIREKFNYPLAFKVEKSKLYTLPEFN